MKNVPRIAIFLPDTPDNYFVDVLMGIVQYSRSRVPWQLDLAGAGDVTVANLRELDCDGIILGADSRAPGLARSVLSVGIPAVNVARAKSDQFPQVKPDDLSVGRLAARTFLERGFRNFGYCTVAANEQTLAQFDADRYQGFRDEVVASHHTVSLHASPTLWGEYGRLQGRAHSDLGRWLSQLPRPAAVLAATDVRGRHVLLSARQASLRVPEDLAVIGVDNSPTVCETTTPGLSSIQLDGRKAGYTAAGILDRLMQGQPAQGPALISPLKLVERRSSDVLAMEDPEVAEAFRFIAENARRPIRVDDVVAAVPISRRVLERRFRRMLSRSIQEEIQRVHVQRAKLLLADEDLSIARVAAAAGFGSPRHLSVAFRRLTGTTPTEFRCHALGAQPDSAIAKNNGNSK